MFRVSLALLLLLAAPASAQVVRDDMWVTNGFVYTSTIVGNTLYMGGQFTRIGPSTGGFMPTNQATGIKTLPSLGVDGAVNAIAADGTGGYIIGGSFKHYRGVERSSLARIGSMLNCIRNSRSSLGRNSFMATVTASARASPCRPSISTADRRASRKRSM